MVNISREASGGLHHSRTLNQIQKSQPFTLPPTSWCIKHAVSTQLDSLTSHHKHSGPQKPPMSFPNLNLSSVNHTTPVHHGHECSHPYSLPESWTNSPAPSLHTTSPTSSLPQPNLDSNLSIQRNNFDSAVGGPQGGMSIGGAPQASSLAMQCVSPQNVFSGTHSESTDFNSSETFYQNYIAPINTSGHRSMTNMTSSNRHGVPSPSTSMSFSAQDLERLIHNFNLGLQRQTVYTFHQVRFFHCD